MAFRTSAGWRSTGRASPAARLGTSRSCRGCRKAPARRSRPRPGTDHDLPRSRDPRPPDLRALDRRPGRTPDAAAVGRYHAWLEHRDPPAAVQADLQAVVDAPAVFDADDLEHFDVHGYVILRSAITPAEAAAAADHLWSLVEGTPDDPDSWYGPRTNGIMIQAFQHPTMEPARRSPRVHKAFAQLWGTADLWGTVDRLSFNPPERPGDPFPGPHLHWDVSLAPQPVPFATQGILYLTDTDADQGALSLVPGFHRRLESWLEALPPDTDPRTAILEIRQLPIAAGAGDLVIWRQDLPHGASPNGSTRPRMAQYVNRYSAEMVHGDRWR